MNTSQSNMSPSAVAALIHDREFRQQLRQQDHAALEKMGLSDHPDFGELPELKVVTSTRDTTYVSMPPLPADGDSLSPEDLSAIQAAGKVSTAGSVGSIGTMSTLCSTASTAVTAGTVGSAGSVDTG